MAALFTLSIVLFGVYLLTAFAAQAGGGARVKALRSGADARGIILWAAKTATNSTIAGVRYESRALRLDVEVPGKPPYELSVTPLIPRVCEALPGSSLDLRVDRSNPSNIAVLGPAGSVGWMGAMPLLFPPIGGRAGGGAKLVYSLFFLPIIGIFGVLSLVGGRSAPRPAAAPKSQSHEMCEAASRCCTKITPSGNCNNYKTMSEQGCKVVLEAERKVAVKMKKVCP